MRKSLSCNGPNVKHFAQCCVEDPTDTNNLVIRSNTMEGAQCPSPKHCLDGLTCVGSNAGVCQPISQDCSEVCGGDEACVNINGTPQCQPLVDNRQRIYDPQCTPAVEPWFRQPDALLVIIFVTDENDSFQYLWIIGTRLPRQSVVMEPMTAITTACRKLTTILRTAPHGMWLRAFAKNVVRMQTQEMGSKAVLIRIAESDSEDYGLVAVQFACEYESTKLTDVREYFIFWQDQLSHENSSHRCSHCWTKQIHAWISRQRGQPDWRRCIRGIVCGL